MRRVNRRKSCHMRSNFPYLVVETKGRTNDARWKPKTTSFEE